MWVHGKVQVLAFCWALDEEVWLGPQMGPVKVLKSAQGLEWRLVTPMAAATDRWKEAKSGGVRGKGLGLEKEFQWGVVMERESGLAWAAAKVGSTGHQMAWRMGLGSAAAMAMRTGERSGGLWEPGEGGELARGSARTWARELGRG